MVAGIGAKLVKFLMWIINVVLFFAGLALMVAAMVVRFSDDTKNWISENAGFKFMGQLDNGLYAIMIAGAVVMFLSFLACCGAVAENRFLLGLFTFLMTIMIIVEFAGLGMLVAFSGDVDAKLKTELRAKLKEAADIYDHKEEGKDVWKFWRFAQNQFECCGIGNFSASWKVDIDADKQDTLEKIEDLKPEDVACKPENENQGCYNAAKDFLKAQAAKVLGVIGVFMILEIISIVFAVFLCCRIGRGYKDIN